MAADRSGVDPATASSPRDGRASPAAARLQVWAWVAAGLSAVLFVLYGLLLRSIPDLQPPEPDADPVFVAGFRLLFVVIGVLLAALYAWRYLAVARAAGAGTLQLRHRRRLRKARTTAIWSTFALTVISVAFASLLPAALPLSVLCLAAAAGWVVAAVVAVHAERTHADVEAGVEQGRDRGERGVP